MQQSWATKFLSVALSLKSDGNSSIRGAAEKGSQEDAWLCFLSSTEQSSALIQLNPNAPSVLQNGIHVHNFPSHLQSTQVLMGLFWVHRFKYQLKFLWCSNLNQKQVGFKDKGKLSS